MASKQRKRAREFIRRINVKDGDLLLIRKGSNMADDIRQFNALRNALGAVGKEKIVVAIVNNFEDVAVWGEEEMNNYGWYRKESVEDN